MRTRCVLIAVMARFLIPATVAAQALETETSRLLARHSIEIGGNFEYQFSSEGRELALPFAIEYGITDRWEFLVEPVPYTGIRPKTGPSATGQGDLEVTLTHRFLDERPGRPALSLAGEVKFPTAESRLIGTDVTDYTVYVIGSKRLGRVDLHANLGYAFLGQPTGVQIHDVINLALAGILDLTPRTQAFAEVLGNTTASAEGNESGAGAEVAGGELSGTVGVRRLLGGNAAASLGVTYDNSGAVLLRPGMTLRLR